MLCQNTNSVLKTIAILPALAVETIMGLTDAHKYKPTHPSSIIFTEQDLVLKKEYQAKMRQIKCLK